VTNALKWSNVNSPGSSIKTDNRRNPVKQQITLDLPDSVSKQAQKIADLKGRSVNTLLAEWIERDVLNEHAQPILYSTETPYGNEEAAKIMQKMIRVTNIPRFIRKGNP
jgi:hypothetical protein